jgi:hypothetical protein
MVLTDTPGTAFDKVSMDIVEPTTDDRRPTADKNIYSQFKIC